MEYLIDSLGDAGALALAGALVGLLFGIFAERSEFCLRASTVEVAEGRPAGRLAVWLLAFFAALGTVQLAQFVGLMDLGEARALAATGSMSGAIIGGLMFGVGMILARGCASRLLVLASTGNLRALVSGLILTLVAQTAYKGVLSPSREYLSGLWTVPGGPARSLAAQLGLGQGLAAALALAGFAAAWWFAARCEVSRGKRLMAAGVGLAVMLGWLLTYLIAQTSFEVVPISSVTFTGPATDTLMVLVDQPGITLSFGIGLVPGVAIGAGASALFARRWAIQRFGANTPMERYLLGAVLMGFGAMLAGGCAVGAGLSGGAALSLTAWLAVFCMWVGAMATHLLLARTTALRPVA
ncbi:YeeE/YedE family protein [Aliishimia ponticola]|uniref:YeeE/YedE family protein n=1 Tax=Aliishimia ponticola TaxID=2499833 RepID=A0A4V3XKR9_9RHOB|nr:YeeE/YedE family protein [Aliishimia ponticola]THH38033.1 YeeE/YedE family protein [Aliishimia ponticola]